jgi:cell shape-determining protein MreC
VSSTVVGTFQRTGDTVSAVDLTVTLGENGVFPGGRPVSYVVRLRKTP